MDVIEQNVSHSQPSSFPAIPAKKTCTHGGSLSRHHPRPAASVSAADLRSSSRCLLRVLVSASTRPSRSHEVGQPVARQAGDTRLLGREGLPSRERAKYAGTRHRGTYPASLRAIRFRPSASAGQCRPLSNNSQHHRRHVAVDLQPQLVQRRIRPPSLRRGSRSHFNDCRTGRLSGRASGRRLHIRRYRHAAVRREDRT